MATTATPNILVGKCVAVRVNGTYAYTVSGNASDEVNVVKVTNARSKGFQQVKAGVRACKGSLKLVYNADDPLNIAPGTEVDLIIDASGSDAISNPTAAGGKILTMKALITTVNETWNVDSDYGIDMNFESSGSFDVAYI